MLQEPSPKKYHSPEGGLLNPLVSNQYVKALRKKVRAQDAHVDHFVQSRSRLMATSGLNSPTATDLSSNGASALAHSDSTGLVAPLAAGDDRRREGTTAIARQIELENMKAR